ncbi:helix-turn-helix domain-containing protein [Arthrobacter dokdonensis]|uniref:helix-turn-helix domain-containing protein n=1 Tax=Arthrobacter dokdonellae TaxID=2211210 RepID=UPI000DE5B3AD|nr:helix-turn-helix transcriptional regulator [Arthrobacter dokdonellae]
MSKPNPDQNVGAFIQRRRGELRVSQGELAAEVQGRGLNWSQGTLSRVELGERPVRLTEALILADALSVPPELLLMATDAVVDVSDESLQNFLWMGLSDLNAMQATLLALGEALDVSKRRWAEASVRMAEIAGRWKQSIDAPDDVDKTEAVERFAQQPYTTFDRGEDDFESGAFDAPATSSQTGRGNDA